MADLAAAIPVDDSENFELDRGEQELRESFIDSFNATTTILVGKEKRIFTYPTSILCRRVPFFKAALKGNWKEALENTIELQEESPFIFAIFLHWLSYEGLNMIHLGEREITYSDTHLVQLYMLADSMQIPKLKNAITETFYERWHDLRKLPTATLQQLFEGTPEKCTLQRLIVDAWSEGIPGEILPINDLVDTVPEMAKSILQLLMKGSAKNEDGYVGGITRYSDGGVQSRKKGKKDNS